MPTRLHRYYGAGYLHFITTSCYQRRPLLGSRQNRDWFLEVLERVRRRYRFVVVGYVVMPEHGASPARRTGARPSVARDASSQTRILPTPSAKASFARRLSPRRLVVRSLAEARVWQPRFYDFVVFTEKKRVEKLRYMHRNPVKRGLVLEPRQWAWSSFRHYADGEPGRVLVNEPQQAKLHVREVT
jgi:putative transposase